MTDPPPAAPSAQPVSLSVDVTGPVGAARFADICLKCAQPAPGRITLTKIFRRCPDDAPAYYAFESIQAPFCESCRRRHAAETRPISEAIKRRLLLIWAVQILPFLLPLATCIFFDVKVVPSILRSSVRNGPPGIALGLAVAALFLGLTWMLLGMIQEKGQRLVHERDGAPNESHAQLEEGPGCLFIAQVEPSSITRAIDFSDDVGQAFDGERHRFTFENAEARGQFAQLNGERRWDPSSTKARTAGKLRWLVLGAVVGFGAFQLIVDLFGRR